MIALGHYAAEFGVAAFLVGWGLAMLTGLMFKEAM